jgi:anti-sigma factor ChrR (cupin superfamily)
MKKFNLRDTVKGWFVGGFSPAVLKTEDVEVAVKIYKKNDYEPSHHHKIATEITVIIKGNVRMNGEEFKDGDIIMIEPSMSTDFLVTSDECITCVVKHPGARDDKYVD